MNGKAFILLIAQLIILAGLVVAVAGFFVAVPQVSISWAMYTIGLLILVFVSLND